MDSLPLELTDHIFGRLDASDLKNCRLVNRFFGLHAASHLFQEVRFVAISDGFRKLHQISIHPQIRNHVHKVTYDARSLPFFKDEAKWEIAADDAETDLRYELDWWDPKYKPYEPKKATYQKYRTTYLAQLVDRGDDLKPLRDALTRFPALRALELHNGYVHVDDDDQDGFFVKDIPEFGPLLRDTYMIPCSEGGYRLLTPRIRSLLHASTACRNPIQQMQLDVRHDFLNSTKDFNTALKAVQNLTDLSLRVIMSSRMLFVPSASATKRKKCSSRLAAFIGAPTNLKKLQIAYLFVGEGPGRVRVGMRPDSADTKAITDEIICRSGKQLRNLKSLTLDQMPTTVDQLLRFMSTTGTLDYLQLRGLTFEAGSWLTFLRALPSKLKVDHFEIRGLISSLRELWIADLNPEGLDEEGCLRRRIEQYVELGGSTEFPLFPDYHPRCYFHHRPSRSQLAKYLRHSQYCTDQKRDFSFRWLGIQSLKYCELQQCTEDCPMFGEGQESGNEESDVDLDDLLGMGFSHPLWELSDDGGYDAEDW